MIRVETMAAFVCITVAPFLILLYGMQQNHQFDHNRTHVTHMEIRRER